MLSLELEDRSVFAFIRCSLKRKGAVRCWSLWRYISRLKDRRRRRRRQRQRQRTTPVSAPPRSPTVCMHCTTRHRIFGRIWNLAEERSPYVQISLLVRRAQTGRQSTVNTASAASSIHRTNKLKKECNKQGITTTTPSPGSIVPSHTSATRKKKLPECTPVSAVF